MFSNDLYTFIVRESGEINRIQNEGVRYLSMKNKNTIKREKDFKEDRKDVVLHSSTSVANNVV